MQDAAAATVPGPSADPGHGPPPRSGPVDDATQLGATVGECDGSGGTRRPAGPARSAGGATSFGELRAAAAAARLSGPNQNLPGFLQLSCCT